tara:strand:- start:1489 stop:1713 length:225 start_codon:yes stop_codon:yes gene_type:complete
LNSENKVNYSLTYSLRLGHDGSIEDVLISPTVIEQKIQRITYDEVDNVLASKEGMKLRDDFTHFDFFLLYERLD